MIFLDTCRIWLKLAAASNVLWGKGTERQLPNAGSFLGLHFCRTEVKQLKLLRHVFRFLQQALSRSLDSTVKNTVSVAFPNCLPHTDCIVHYQLCIRIMSSYFPEITNGFAFLLAYVNKILRHTSFWTTFSSVLFPVICKEQPFLVKWNKKHKHKASIHQFWIDPLPRPLLSQ